MANKITLVIAILSIYLIGCKGPSKSPSLDNYEDTLIAFKYRNQNCSFSFAKDYPTGKEFQRFIDTWSNRNLFYSNVLLCDVTGDGIDDSCFTNIVGDSIGNSYVINSIKAEDKLIWLDSLLINDRAKYQFGNDSAFIFFKPLSTFYLSFNHYYIDYVSHNLYSKDFIATPINPEYWGDYLKHFNGRAISKLDLEDFPTYIWDNRIGKFVLYFMP